MPRSLGKPPDERPNWHALNEGQRRYAWEQYNLARIRRGLTIDHPIPELYQPVTEDISPPATQHEEVPETPPGSNEQAVDHVNESDFDEDELDILAEELSDAEDDFVPPTPPEQLPVRTTMAAIQQTPQAAADSTNPRKRTHMEANAPPPSTARRGMRLPGTARPQGGIDTAGGDPEPIPRPFTSDHTEVRTYRKVHRFLTFGLAYVPLTVTRGTGEKTWTDTFMMTPMAEIPWDRLFMYMNPAEYTLLPRGAEVIHMSCQIRSENIRIAFPTNASATNLATLNQNKFLRIGIGLKQNTQGVNIKPLTFKDDQPMITETFAEQTNLNADYDQYITDFYGYKNNLANFLTHTPRHQFGLPFSLQWYYAPVTQASDNTRSGWINFQEKIKEFEGDSQAGNKVIHITYKPQNGLINPSIRSIFTGLPSAFPGNDTLPAEATKMTFVGGTGTHLLRSAEVSYVSNVPTLLSESNIGYRPASDYGETALLNQIIEKSQYITNGLEPSQNAKSCPSIHVGLQPVIALTSKSIGAPAVSSYTDAQGFFEVVCEAKVKCCHPTERPLAEQPNCTPYEMMWLTGTANPQTLQTNKSMLHGLYQY